MTAPANEYIAKAASLAAIGYKKIKNNASIDHPRVIIQRPLYDFYEYFYKNTKQEMVDKFGTTSWIDFIKTDPYVKECCLEQVAGEEEQEGDAGDSSCSWFTRYVCCDEKTLDSLYKTFEAVKVLRIVRASDENKPPEKQLLKYMGTSVARICHVLINDRSPHGDRKLVQPLMTTQEFVSWWQDRVTEAGNKAPTAKAILGMKNLAKQRIEADRASMADIMATLEEFKPIKDIKSEHLDKMVKIETAEDAASLLHATLKLLKEKGMSVPVVNWDPTLAPTNASCHAKAVGKVAIMKACHEVRLECDKNMPAVQ
jgi:hypothetical protein